ncbi:MAG: OmpA family protein [bacterium]
MRRRWLLLALALVAVIRLPSARADEKNRAAESQLFKPAFDHFGVFTVESGRLAKQWQWGFKLNLQSSAEPMSLNLLSATAGGSVPVVQQSLTTTLQAYVALFRFLQVNLEVALVRHWLGNAFDLDEPTGFTANDPISNTRRSPSEVVAGDARLALKWGLLGIKGFHLALLTTLTIPIGDETVMAGEKGWAGEARVAFSLARGPVVLAANIGYLLREKSEILEPVAYREDGTRNVLLELNDELLWGAGAKFRFFKYLALGVELYGSVPLLAKGPKDLPIQVLAGLLIHPTPDVVLALGGGAGIGRYLERDGVKPLGRSPLWTAFATVSFAPIKRKKKIVIRDRDGDGIPDHLDRCPDQPEDKDGFEDEDGCPDPDNDQDGIPDHLDKCPNEAEDRDGFQDSDGCPDLDNDRDGIPDAVDKCPNVPEDMNGVEDDDGCPEGGRARTIAGDKIDLKGERVEFYRKTAVLKPPSKKVLDRVANLIRSATAVRLIRIEAHTDGKKSARYNLRLSRLRAVTVRNYLVSRGAPAGKLATAGYGKSRPIATNRTKKGREKNRRVEFIIVLR